MNRKYWIAGAAALALGAATAHAADSDVPATGVFMDGATLYDACRSTDANEIEVCNSYIKGVWDALGLLADTGTTERYLCADDGTGIEDLRARVLEYMAGRDLKHSAVSLVTNGLAEKYRCS